MKHLKKAKKPTFEEIIMGGWAADEFSILSVMNGLSWTDFEATEKLLEEFTSLNWTDDLELKIRQILIEELCYSKEEIADISIKDEFKLSQKEIGAWFYCEARAEILKNMPFSHD